MVNNKLVKLCIEVLGHRKSTLLISQNVNISLSYLPQPTLNIKCERFLKQFHKIPISVDVPEGILNADE